MLAQIKNKRFLGENCLSGGYKLQQRCNCMSVLPHLHQMLIFTWVLFVTNLLLALCRVVSLIILSLSRAYMVQLSIPTIYSYSLFTFNTLGPRPTKICK